MAILSDDHLRALRFLARHPGGCTEPALLKQGFTAGQLSHLVFVGLAKIRGGAGRPTREVGSPTRILVKITTAGRKAITE